VAARIDFAFDFEVNFDWISFTSSESFFSCSGELFSVLLLVLSITFWWNHIWDISWMWLDIFQVFFVAIGGVLLISGEVNRIVLIEVPRMVSDNVWDNLGVGFDSVVLHSLGISNGLWVLIDLSKSWLDLVSGWVLSLMVPGLGIRLVMLVMVPGVLSLDVWFNCGVRILRWVGFGSNGVFFLKERWSDLCESWLDLVSRWVLGLMIPSFSIGLIVLIMVPGVLSLDVWLNCRVRILGWVGNTIFLGEAWKHLISGWTLGLSVPLLLAGHIELIFIPGVLSLDVWGNFGVRIL